MGGRRFDFTVETYVAQGFALRGREGGAQVEVEGDRVGALRSASGGSSRSYVAFQAPGGSGVRRLTSRETERLQGFEDDWTRIPFGRKGAERCPNTLRQHATGNSFSVPVVRWIGDVFRNRRPPREGS